MKLLRKGMKSEGFGVLTCLAKFTVVWFGSSELTAFAFPNSGGPYLFPRLSAADDELVFSCVIVKIKKDVQRFVYTNTEKLDKYRILEVWEPKRCFFSLHLPVQKRIDFHKTGPGRWGWRCHGLDCG